MAEFLMKAHKWDGVVPKCGLWVSEKMDGHRAFWDGGVTIGKRVPWSSDTSTGWWSNGGKAIRVPMDWTIWMLENKVGPTEGELWGGRGTFQSVSSVVRATVSERDWGPTGMLPYGVKFYMTGPVDWGRFLDIRQIKVRNEIVGEIKYEDRVALHGLVRGKGCIESLTFRSWYEYWTGVVEKKGIGRILVASQRLIYTKEEINESLEKIIESGGEGLMLRKEMGYLCWEPKRTKVVMKLKAVQDGEAIVTGVTEGKDRLLGMIGALLVYDGSLGLLGKHFEIGTGLSDEARRRGLDYWKGKTVRYKYRELTKAGIPKEARFICCIPNGLDYKTHSKGLDPLVKEQSTVI